MKYIYKCCNTKDTISSLNHIIHQYRIIL